MYMVEQRFQQRDSNSLSLKENIAKAAMRNKYGDTTQEIFTNLYNAGLVQPEDVSKAEELHNYMYGDK